MSNDALFVDTTQEAAEAGLLALMAGISEELWCAGWLTDLEFDLWAMMTGAREDRGYGMGVVSDRQIELLRLLSEEAGGWWTNCGEEFVNLEKWRVTVAERKEAAAQRIVREKQTHRSDCAIYNEPALPAGPCNCGAKPTPNVPLKTDETKS